MLNNPFDLNDEKNFKQWKLQKLKYYPKRLESQVIRVNNSVTLSDHELKNIRRACRRANFCVYKTDSTITSPQLLLKLAHQLGLESLDHNLCSDDSGISLLQVSESGPSHDYIPYSNKAIKWHTDGYYNSQDTLIRSMILHCVSTAQCGGENAFLDHEIAYLLMRDENPHYVQALMQSNAMSIPANIADNAIVRPAISGPVFSVNPESGKLHMRYTARTRSIEWKKDKNTTAAVKFLNELLESDLPYIFRYRLQPGEGLVCNNILHNRTEFENSPSTDMQRLIYRARYYDRIQGS